MGRLGKAFKMSKRKPGAEEEDDDDGSGSEPEKQPQQQQSKPAAAAAAAPAPPPKAAADGNDNSDDDGDGEGEGGPETRGQMVQRHKRELMALKKSSQRAKGAGKAEAAKAIADLEARHAKELAELESRGQGAGGGAAAAGAAGAAASASAAAGDRASKYLADVSLAEGGESAAHPQSKGPTKAQRRREKLAQREQERDARIAAELAALGPTERAREAAELRALLAPLGLAVKSIRADGHCLYHSVADQLAQHPSAADGEGAGGGPLPDYLALRKLAAEHMRARRPDFEPFVAAAEAAGRVPHGEDGREEEEEEEAEEKDAFEAYVRAVEQTAAWGGHVELTALAGALRRRIRVVAAGMPEVVAGEEFGDGGEGELTVCYVRHEFGLGEHYNSVRPRGEGEEEEEEEEGEAEGAAAGGGGAEDE